MKNTTKKQPITELSLRRRRSVEKEKMESEIKRIKEAHRLSREQYNTLAENARDGIYVINVDHGFEYVNPAFEKIFGYKAEEVVRNDFKHDNLIHPDDKEFLRKRKNAREKGKKIPSLYEFRIITKKGEVRRVEVNTVLLPGKEKNILGILRDITERNQREEELKKNQDKLAASENELKIFSRAILSIREEERKNLSTVLHHEAGSMAIVCCSSLNNIQEDIHNNALQNALKALEETKSTLMKFLSRIKDIAVSLRPMDLEERGLPYALNAYFSEIAQNANIKLDFQKNLIREKIYDEVGIAIFRIAQESINNIIKHAEATEVEVHLYSCEHSVTINIRDNGNGFHMSSKKVNSQLGLRSMKEMVESLGGQFKIESASKQGTAISVTLPN